MLSWFICSNMDCESDGQTDSDHANQHSSNTRNQAEDTRRRETRPSIGARNNEHENNEPSLLYSLEESPSWYVNLLLALQHYLMFCAPTLVVPIMVSKAMCIPDGHPATGMMNSTVLFVSGIITILQTTIGTRLPIIQGVSYAFLSATFAILSTDRWRCPMQAEIDKLIREANGTFDYDEIWKPRARELQGAFIIASVFEIVLGVSGAVAVLQRYLGPLTIAPVITLIGLSLFDAVFDAYCSKHIGIAVLTMALIIVFSQYLSDVKIPIPSFNSEGSDGVHVSGFPFFQLFSIAIGVVLAWILCAILTAAGLFADTPDGYGYWARTDTRLSSIADSPWFRVPYPGQWGAPTFSIVAGVGLMTGVIASILESLGDYYACARICEVSPPPNHAVSRGIAVEGFGITLAGLWGGGFGSTTYTTHIGVITMTKVASRSVIQVTGLLLILFGCFGKFGAFFATVPDPIIGGLCCVLLGLLVAIGIANIQFVDINSSRNLFVFGFAIFMGIALPTWLKKNPDVIQTGNDVADQMITILGTTGMFVGGAIGFFFDNTIPGTQEERGLTEWTKQKQQPADYGEQSADSCYNFHPTIMRFISRKAIFGYLPFCPTFRNQKSFSL